MFPGETVILTFALLSGRLTPCLWLLVLFWLGAGPTLRSDAQSAPPRRVLVLLVPGLRADDLIRLPLPGLATLQNEGAAGWMVCRAAHAPDRRYLAPDGRDTSASLALTLGSGARALYGAGNREEARGSSMGKGETPTTLFLTPPASLSSSLLVSLLNANTHLDHAVAVGALGDLIHEQGWQTAVIGSADAETADVDGLLLAMDGKGRIDRFSKALKTRPLVQYAPYGKRDDTQALVRAAVGLPPRTALCVLVFGDLARADRYGPLCLPTQRDAHRDMALRALDTLLTDLHRQICSPSNTPPAHPPTRLYLLASAPASSTDTVDRLSPLLLWGSDLAAGTLVSPSTRTPGVAINTDFLPTLAAAFDLPPPSATIGRALTVQPMRMSNSLPRSNTLVAWRAMHDSLLQSERLKDVYGGLPTLQMLFVLSALAAFGTGRRRAACALGVAIVALPLGMLLLPSLPWTPRSTWGAGLILTLFTLLLALLASHAYSHPGRVSRVLRALFAILLLTISLDLLTGSHLLRQAWMSYAVLEAARFYGIGNEYMGAVIGAACILVGSRRGGNTETWKQDESSTPNAQRSLLLALLCSLSLLFLLGYNRFGAKVGAVPSAGMALGVELLLLWRGKLQLRDILLVFGVALLLLAGLAGLDLRHGTAEQSHLARVFAGSGGVFGNLSVIARRKLLLEGYLLLHSPWSAALLSASCGFWWLTRAGNRETRNRETGKEEARGKRQEKAIVNRQSTIAGLTAGTVASLLCNDSGVTAAALIMLFGFAWALAQEAGSNIREVDGDAPAPARPT